MDYQRFYQQLFQPIEERIGHVDDASIMAIVGFDCGGPVTLSTVGYGRDTFVTYVTCELSVNKDQQPAGFGRFELMMTCDNEKWARDILTRLGRMSFGSVLGHGHTVDIGPIVEVGHPLQGLVLESFAQVSIDGNSYGIMQVHGITRPELNFARAHGADAFLLELQRSGVYPRTSVYRKDSVFPDA